MKLLASIILSVVCLSVRAESPVAAQRTFDVLDYGARADGSRATAAFRKAIEDCAAAGGGRVTVPAGTYFTGPIHLRSNVDFHLDEGAVLDFSDEPADYLPAVPSSWEGIECWNYSPLVYGYGCTNVALTGKGLLRPRMAKWKAIMEESKTDIASARAVLYKWGSEDYPVEKRDMTQTGTAVMRPQLVQFNRSKDVLIEDVRIKESPFWTIHLLLCENVTVRNVEVDAHGFNNDAIDIEMTRNVLIDGGTFTAGDDGFVFKAGRNRDAWRLGVPTENVLVRNAHVKFAHSLLCVGSEMSAGVRNVRVENCRVDSCHRFFYVKTNARRGGFVENIELDGVKAEKVDQVLKVDTDVLYQWRALPTYEERITKISNLVMSNVEVGEAGNAVALSGDARNPIDGVTLRSVLVNRVTKEPISVKNARNVDLSGLRIGGSGESGRRMEEEQRNALVVETAIADWKPLYGTEWSFDYTPKGLAMPETGADFGQEILKVTGLSEGHYLLQSDGATVGYFTAGELAKGVDLAVCTKRKNVRRAAAEPVVEKLCLEKVRTGEPAGCADPILLWPDGNKPFSENEPAFAEHTGRWQAWTDVTHPRMFYFPATNRQEKCDGPRPAIVVCPGGAYAVLSTAGEGVEIAKWANALGYHAFVLLYRTASTAKINPDGAHADAEKALEMVRARAAEWSVDPKKVGMIGFSAGANLTARTCCGRVRPDFALTIYPYWTEADSNTAARHEFKARDWFRPDAKTPPCFIVQAQDDACRVESGLTWYVALKYAGVPTEMHLFPKGGHGYGLARRHRDGCEAWPALAAKWIERVIR